jgi:hypothetical protein
MAGAIAVVGADRADVAGEVLRLAADEAARRPVTVVDLLGEESILAKLVAGDDPHGASDAVRYGLSLSKVARAHHTTPNLFLVPGGAETPLQPDVLASHRWLSWAEKARRGNTLLLVAAPSDHDALGPLLDRLDGMVVIGDGPAPITRSPLVARVRSGRAPRPRPAPPAAPAPRRRVRGFALGAALVAVAAVGAWGLRAQLTRGGDTSSPDRDGRPSVVMPGDVVPGAGGTSADPTDGSPWSVELASVNSSAGALARVRQTVDSLPVPTYSPTLLGATTAPWYRLVAGAFTSSASAESLLVLLRLRGVLEAEAGRVIRAPYAWLLEDSLPPELTTERLFAWRQQGLPAYALYGSSGLARIYAGAFESEAEARLLAPVLDSLNIHATLSTRVGSVR